MNTKFGYAVVNKIILFAKVKIADQVVGVVGINKNNFSTDVDEVWVQGYLMGVMDQGVAYHPILKSVETWDFMQAEEYYSLVKRENVVTIVW